MCMCLYIALGSIYIYENFILAAIPYVIPQFLFRHIIGAGTATLLSAPETRSVLAIVPSLVVLACLTKALLSSSYISSVIHTVDLI